MFTNFGTLTERELDIAEAAHKFGIRKLVATRAGDSFAKETTCLRHHAELVTSDLKGNPGTLRAGLKALFEEPFNLTFTVVDSQFLALPCGDDEGEERE